VRSIVPRSLGRSVGPWLAVLTLTAAGAAAAAGYGLTAPKRYRATAQLLVSPVSVSDPTFTGLDVLRDSAGKRTAAASAAALLRSPQIADVVRADLGLPRSRDSLLAALDTQVVDSSNVVAITVEDTSAAGAAQLANAFADGLVKQRTASFQSQLASTIRRDEQLMNAIPPARRATGAGAALENRLVVLRGFQGQPDPTIRHAGQASAPVSASWPKLPKLAAAGAGAGLAAGLVVALLLVFGGLGRRRTADRGAPYDRGVSDRLVERLEQRVTERIAALEAERERLSAREAALGARERDVSAKLAELRAASAAGALPQQPALGAGPAAPSDAAALDARAAALDARIKELTQREIGLARRAAAIATQSQDNAGTQDTTAAEALDARAAALDVRIKELTQREIGLARRAAELAKQEQGAAMRTDELDRREQQLDLRTGEHDRRAAELEARLEEARREEASREPEPEPVSAFAPAASPARTQPDGPGDDGVPGHWNLMALERLVNDRADEFPEKRDEWVSYLYFLREYGEPDGTIPSSFDWLIQDTFAELVP
jgi:capsular polysaccharide biosynthesis protein